MDFNHRQFLQVFFIFFGLLHSASISHFSLLLLPNGLFTLPDPDSDPYSDSDSCNMQKFHIGSDSDSDPLIEMYAVGYSMGTITIWETI